MVGLKLKIRIAGKVITLIEYTFALIVVVVGTAAHGRLYFMFEQWFHVNAQGLLAIVATVCFLLMSQLEYGTHVWATLQEQIFILGGNKSMLRKYFTANSFPVWMISAGFGMMINASYYGVIVDFVWISLVYWIENFFVFSYLYGRHNVIRKYTLSAKTVSVKNRFLRALIRNFQVRHRYVIRELFKIFMSVAVIMLHISGLKNEYLGLFLVAPCFVIAFSNETYWIDESTLLCDIAARGCSLRYYAVINVVTALIDDLLLFWISSASIGLFTPAIVIKTVFIDTFINIVLLFSALKFRFSPMINAVLETLLALALFIPIVNIMIFLFILSKIKKHLKHGLGQVCTE